MRVYRSPFDRLPAPSILAIGSFDGLHLGHQALFTKLKQLSLAYSAQNLVYTFDLPTKVLLEGCDFLYTLTEKLEILDSFGIDEVIIVPFTREFANRSATEFLNDIKILQPLTVIAGEDFRFGKERQGSLIDLAQIAPVITVSTETIGEQAIKASKIRQLIENHQIEDAKDLLGRPYTASGLVIEGDKLGRKLGFPTVNIDYQKGKLLPLGVFLVRLWINEIHYYGIANIGFRPTVSGNEKRFEVHIFDFSQDIYGIELRVDFLKFLRSEVKFGNLEALRAQLELDKENALQILKTMNYSK